MPITDAVRDCCNAIDGLISERVGVCLAELAENVPADLAIVEIGSYRGRSACFLAAGSAAGHRAPVFAVDPWDTPGNAGGRFGFNQPSVFESFLANVRAAGYADLVTALRGFAVQVAPFWTRPIGLLYIDGSHIEQDVRSDWASWSTYLAPRCAVVFDDYGTPRNPGVTKIVDQLRARYRDFSWTIGPDPLVIGERRG